MKKQQTPLSVKTILSSWKVRLLLVILFGVYCYFIQKRIQNVPPEVREAMERKIFDSALKAHIKENMPKERRR